MKIAVSLGGKVALVTGPGPLASAIAEGLRENRAEVVSARLDEARSELRRTAKAYGRLDILVNAAAGPAGYAPADAVEQLCRDGAAVMASGGGRIVNLASAVGLVPVRGVAAEAMNAAAIFSLTRALALELGGKTILVNGIAVGAVEGDDDVGERMKSHVPLARKALPDEVAAAALFLVDPDNTYMSGHILTVDGGWSAGFARDF